MIEKLIAITKDERNKILERFPHTHIVRTMKQDSKRHHYYMVEDNAPMRLLRSLRGLDTRSNSRGKHRRGA